MKKYLFVFLLILALPTQTQASETNNNSFMGLMKAELLRETCMSKDPFLSGNCMGYILAGYESLRIGAMSMMLADHPDMPWPEAYRKSGARISICFDETPVHWQEIVKHVHQYIITTKDNLDIPAAAAVHVALTKAYGCK